MRKVNFLGLFEADHNIELGDGTKIVATQELIEIKKENLEMILVIEGGATIIYKESGKKEVSAVSKGEACFFSANDESVMLQEGSIVLTVDKRIRQNRAESTKKIGFFGNKIKLDKSLSQGTTEQASKNNILSEMIPKIRQAWYQVAGPLSESIVNDEARLKEVASTVYTVLPIPVRMVIKEDFFVKWCYEKRHIILVEPPSTKTKIKKIKKSP